MKIFDVISGWAAPYMLYIKIAAIAALMAATWHAHTIVDKARANDAINNSIDLHLAAEDKSLGIGLNLENVLNDYKFGSIEADRKVNDATPNDFSGRFDSGSVQRTAQRIAAGEAARQRIKPVR